MQRIVYGPLFLACFFNSGKEKGGKKTTEIGIRIKKKKKKEQPAEEGFAAEAPYAAVQRDTGQPPLVRRPFYRRRENTETPREVRGRRKRGRR